MCYVDMKRDHKKNRKESKERTVTPGKGSKSLKCFTSPSKQIFCQHFVHQIIKGGNVELHLQSCRRTFSRE